MSRLKSTPEGRKLIWPALFGTLIIVVGVWAANPPQSGRDSFFQGNQAYSQGRYEDAIAHYRAALRSEGVSASLLFNLANAYQRQGNLNYERALAIDPANADIRANLQGLRKNLGLYREEAPLWVRFFETLSLNAWTLIASGAFFAIGLLFLIRGVLPFVRKQREAGKPLGCLAVRDDGSVAHRRLGAVSEPESGSDHRTRCPAPDISF